MAWLEFIIHTQAKSIEAVAGALTAGGFEELLMEDAAEFSQFLEENRAYWDYIDEELETRLEGLSQIKLYLEDTDSASRQCLEALVEHLRPRYGELPMEVKPLADTDWSESWKENYPPQSVGEGLVVLPCWLADTDTQGKTPVILDPGLTFGTGAHPSTQMVMQTMEAQLKPGMACLDLGSGSGILSITALRLGAKSAVGVDIDPKAEDIARENCGYNGFAAPEFTALTGNVLEDSALMASLRETRYDMVLVNIVADVIIGLAPVLPTLMGRDTLLICSGILDSRLDDVTAALTAAGLEILQVRQQEEWRCALCKRRTI